MNNGERITTARGEKVGWIEKDDVYLDPDSSYAVAQKLLRDQNDSLPVTAQTLRKRLKEKGLLASSDGASETIMVRHTVEGKRRYVLHLHTSIFLEGLPPIKNPAKRGKTQPLKKKLSAHVTALC